ncbi:hypothetical protein AX774_g3351 [Zancudomyces culisetae]|uniref:SCP domain-containing protein n=1 Tax=Zancudomyces culisetae TaxID=1213189 RepID=A0A1R1PQ94_ZANCU|nr:hypothetical protein AX774_g3351 [Zancudomyces culisetae]|eukprot:OMH83155.1 hypothetical protein AX774_g3351 [Zancudomyces culisetae]
MIRKILGSVFFVTLLVNGMHIHGIGNGVAFHNKRSFVPGGTNTNYGVGSEKTQYLVNNGYGTQDYQQNAKYAGHVNVFSENIGEKVYASGFQNKKKRDNAGNSLDRTKGRVVYRYVVGENINYNDRRKNKVMSRIGGKRGKQGKYSGGNPTVYIIPGDMMMNGIGDYNKVSTGMYGSDFGGSGGYDRDSLTMLSLVNNLRASRGLRPVSLDSSLMNAAEQQSSYQNNIGKMTHDNKNYSNLEERYKAAGVNGRSMGENVAEGMQSPYDAFRAWSRSPGHLANMLGNFSRVGFSRVNNYWTQAFAL